MLSLKKWRKERLSPRETKALALFMLSIFFMVGIWNMDLGASLKGSNYRAEGLILVDLEPRVIYHIGLMISIGCFLFLGFLYIREVFR